MYILGLNAFHGDSSACLIHDGLLVAAAEEERFRRIKHWSGFPSESIRYCLTRAGITLADVDYVAINQNPRSSFFKKFFYTVTKWPDFNFLLKKIKVKRERTSIKEYLKREFREHEFKGKIYQVEHHLSHLASAFYVSPFEEAIAVSVDGFGDFASAAWGVGNGIHIDVGGKVYFPHSLGIYYQAMTQFIGFPNYGDEYKVMGLAPYGKPTFLPQMREIVLLEKDGTFKLNLKYFRHHRERIEYDLGDGQSDNPPEFGNLFSSEIEKLLGPAKVKEAELTQRHMDIAASIQAMYEEAFFHLLNYLYIQHPFTSLVVAGGCGMNSVANGKIKLRTPFKHVYIQSAAGDAGGAIGAALFAWHQVGGMPALSRGPIHDHAYWGPEFSNDEIQKVLQEHQSEIKNQNCTVGRIDVLDELYFQTAQFIAEGKIIGWFQGGMEWGPRALGNRSILADPRRSDAKDILNLKIKRRESFRPFAPSILRDSVSEWFEQDDDVPFMMQVFQIKLEKRSLIPAVTHVDGSGRLQTVNQRTNPRYYGLIREFNKLTGVPMLLNTSFNENEPVVCTPQQALNCFLRTKMDVLVMGNWVIKRDM